MLVKFLDFGTVYGCVLGTPRRNGISGCQKRGWAISRILLFHLGLSKTLPRSALCETNWHAFSSIYSCAFSTFAMFISIVHLIKAYTFDSNVIRKQPKSHMFKSKDRRHISTNSSQKLHQLSGLFKLLLLCPLTIGIFRTC